MKKRLMSILISAIMILTSLVPITSSAEETVNIFETYTFEEFLSLSEEEICAISDDIAKEYTIRRDEVIKKLSKELTKVYGKGFDYSSLYKYLKFYKTFPKILDSLSPKSLQLL